MFAPIVDALHYDKMREGGFQSVPGSRAGAHDIRRGRRLPSM
jgi:hypothetical protein